MSNVFTAGVAPGGLRSLEEIQILICYMLSSIGEAVPREMLPEIIAGNGMANFFDVGAAMDDLLKKGYISESGSGRLTVASGGRQISETLFRTLPFTLRERAVNLAIQLLSRARSRSQSNAAIEKTDDGFVVTCQLLDGEKPMLSVSMVTADALQAETVKKNFLQDPAVLYRATLAVLNGQYADEDGKLRILL